MDRLPSFNLVCFGLVKRHKGQFPERTVLGIMTEEFLAHVRQFPSGEWVEHGLAQHLQDVASLAGKAAIGFGATDWASVAGLWHDLGKYKPDFQAYIRTVSGYHADAHLENTPGKVDHSTAGAIHAIQKHPGIGRILAYLIAGHHSGLPDWFKAEAEGRGLDERLKDVRHLDESKQSLIPNDILEAALPTSRPPHDAEQAHLWIRMLFSCLVDADFLDTEAFMDPQKSASRSAGATLKELQDKFAGGMRKRDAGLKATSQSETTINKIRRVVLADCLSSAQKEPGFFSLTVPTGGGKTLSSVAFALEHALKYGKDRIVVVIPYTSIIEQTAQTLSDIFGSENVLEHHSNLDLDRETPQGRLAAENWDAPIIVTTNVQLFESLFAARTSRCRKLHNLVNSVIILDEAQMLPPEFLAPTLSVLKGLTTYFGCSVVLCTATQPALIGEIGTGLAKFQGLENVREMVADPVALSGNLQRVVLRFHGPDRVDWPSLSSELIRNQQVLCIVNRRQDCRDLWQELSNHPECTPVHLSALMCGEHRSAVIRQIKKDLVNGKPLCVVSTQLVEAGVDIDFPVVYRAMAGLDSIAQAAGRCNREGRNLEGKLGEVVVFNPPKPAPPGLLRKGEDAANEVIRMFPDEVAKLSSTAFQKYFKIFYGHLNDFGRKSFKDYFLTNASAGQFQFRSAAQWYKLIDEQGYRGIIVWYTIETATKDLSSLKILADIKQWGPSRDRMRRLQRFTVNVPERIWKDLRDQGAIQELRGPEGPLGLWAQSLPGLYDDTFGLRLEGPSFTGTEFIC